jgi:signal peptidase I
MLDLAGMSEVVKRDLAVEALASFGQLRLIAQGTSMIPGLWPGDTLLVRQADVEQVSPGDILLCRWAGGLRIHRLLAKVATSGATLLVTRGDALSGNDPPVPASDLLGRVSAVVSGRVHKVPRRQLSFGQEAVALLVRRSAWATRLLLRARFLAATAPARRGCCLP